jgi:ribosome-associated protein
MKSKKNDALALVKTCCRVLDDKKASDLSVLDVSEQSSITDYLILATATSDPHLRALRIELEKTFDEAGVQLVGKETAQESGWMVIDAFDIMVHLFLSEQRERFGLERLWRDSREVNVEKLLRSEVEKPAKKRPTVAPRRTKSAAKGKKKGST